MALQDAVRRHNDDETLFAGTEIRGYIINKLFLIFR